MQEVWTMERRIVVAVPDTFKEYKDSESMAARLQMLIDKGLGAMNAFSLVKPYGRAVELTAGNVPNRMVPDTVLKSVHLSPPSPALACEKWPERGGTVLR